MPANIDPIYSKIADIQWITALTAANTAMDGTGTVSTAFTADATNGGYVSKLRIKPLGTNVATVMRIFINNGSTNATAANNVLYGEVTLIATTAIATQALNEYDYPMNLALPAGYKINVVLGTAVAAGYVVAGIGGKY
jgi:hypothetical protein